MRRFLNSRTLITAGMVLLVVSVSLVVGLYIFINSPAFNERIRAFVVEKIATYTGAKVSLGTLRWSLKQQRVVLEDLTLRGTEPASEPPLAHIESISAGVNFRSLLNRHIDLYELHIVNPEIRLRVDSKGRTTLPSPAPPETENALESRFVISIDNLKVTGGKAFINDQQSNIDFAITNLKSDLSYRPDTQVSSVQASFDGTLAQSSGKPLPYTISTDFDFTQGTVVAKKTAVTSGKSTATFQGRIDKVLTHDIAGKLDYSATLESGLVKRFLPKDTAVGTTAMRGALEFSASTFKTTGDGSSQSVEIAGWKAGPLKAAYSYQYATKQLSLTRVSAQALGGTAEGMLVIDHVPGVPHTTLNLTYAGVDVAELARVYPWDKKYVIHSRADGRLEGWIDGQLEKYEIEGDASLQSYGSKPASDNAVVALPVDGTLAFSLKPGVTDIRSSDLHYLNSTINASGRILGTSEAELTVSLASANLADFSNAYPEANGKGAFKGTLQGPVSKPVINGDLTLDGFKYRDWTIRDAKGGVRLDMASEVATLRNVSGRIGDSTATLNGTASLDGKSVNLQIRSDRVRPEDFETLIKEKVTGVLSGNATLTSVNPIQVTGHVKAVGLTARGHTFEVAEGDVTYNDPQIQLKNFSATEGTARLTARTLDYNRSTGSLRAEARITSVALNRLKEFGVPDTLSGIVSSADLNVTGTEDRPQVRGNAIIENLSFHGETFPSARVDLTTEGSKLNFIVSETGNASLSGHVDLYAKGYPFEADVKFQNYSVEKLAHFSKGTVSVTGAAKLNGQLDGQVPFTGKGTISTLAAKIRDVEFHSTGPFEFALDPNKIRIDKNATFSGAYKTRVDLKGSVGLSDTPALDLDVGGTFDLSEISGATEAWSTAGTVTLDGHVGGTASDPAITGTLAIANASVGHEGPYPTLTALNGSLRFNENRVTFDNLAGRMGSGDVHIRGTSIIQNSRLENLNVRLEANQVRLRYSGLRSAVTGGLTVTGTSDSPLVQGSLTLDSFSYRSSFESFLALFRAGGLDSGGSPLDRVRLAIHIDGNRNISVQNELADISQARVSLDVLGTWGKPALAGHMEATEGTLFFQGKKYDITRGNVDFVDQLKIVPRMDIQAETDVREYRVILTVTGEGEKVRAQLRSDPPLPDTELVSLISGGKTREELPQDSKVGSEQLFQGGAYNILAGLVSSKVGARFGLSGLDWIRIDPHFEGTATNPSVRITLTQQVNKELSVTYSQDLASTQQRVVTIEYFLSKNLSVVASREENIDTSALGLDIKLRRRF